MAVWGDYEYEDNGDGTCTITAYYGSDTDLVIPEQMGGLDVVAIVDGEIDFVNKEVNGVFLGRGIDSVQFPNTLKYIGDVSFAMNNLIEIEIENVKNVGLGAFTYNQLTSIYLPNVENIGGEAFANNAISRAIISSSNTISLGDYIFENNQLVDSDLILVGHDPSTVKDYALQYGYTFEEIVEAINPPIVNVISATRMKLSNNEGMDESSILFKFGFDQDISEWRVVLLGSSHDTGTILDSGNFVSRGSELIAIVNASQLYSEGDNRINFYGKSFGGEWTPYNDDRLIEEESKERLSSIYGRSIYGTSTYGGFAVIEK